MTGDYLLVVAPPDHPLLSSAFPNTLVIATDFGKSSHYTNPGTTRDWRLGRYSPPAGDQALVLMYEGRPVESSFDHLLRVAGRQPLQSYNFPTVESARWYAAYFVPPTLQLETAPPPVFPSPAFGPTLE
jgi:hypothetical protein